jgi:hypothetical protein
MTSKELRAALRLITKVSADPRVGHGQRNQLLIAKRELVKVSRSGKLEERKVFLAVEVVASVLLQIVER